MIQLTRLNGSHLVVNCDLINTQKPRRIRCSP